MSYARFENWDTQFKEEVEPHINEVILASGRKRTIIDPKIREAAKRRAVKHFQNTVPQMGQRFGRRCPEGLARELDYEESDRVSGTSAGCWL